ncbi:MAG: imidazole glycerol phosphate synthase subunit HisH [Acidaminococcales bacterium]|jgi:glutamine amidotransferase|nr:imidazole glycerol phosphate synthase subunit HisH [Acidaminococcales bacterium]
MIVIVDYGVGNLHSVAKAMEKVGAKAAVSSDAAAVAAADRLILPGVGSFGHCMKNLSECGLAETVKDYARSGRPFLGICVGMQILFDGSEESPGVPGLGILPGMVRRLPDRGLKIPQIGWNCLDFRAETPLFCGLPAKEYVYFVHSYHAEPLDRGIIAASAEYGATVTAAVVRGNIWATQFHPEKSGEAGLTILSNFKDVKI